MTEDKNNAERCDHAQLLVRYEKTLAGPATTAELAGVSERDGAPATPDEGWTVNLTCGKCGASSVGLPAGPLPGAALGRISEMPEVEAGDGTRVVVSAAIPYGALAFGVAFEGA